MAWYKRLGKRRSISAKEAWKHILMAVNSQHVIRTGIRLNNRVITSISNEDVSISLQMDQTLNLAFGLSRYLIKLSISQNELSKVNNTAPMTGSKNDAIKFAIREIDFLDMQ
jgi:hypothetical protein